MPQLRVAGDGPSSLDICLFSGLPNLSEMPPMKPYGFGVQAVPLAAIGAALWLFTSSCAAQSSGAEGSGIRISGFGTIGFVHADAPAGWGFLRSIEQPSSTRDTRWDLDSRLGIQLNYAPNSQIELVGQLVAARRESSASATDAVEWAFASYRPNADWTFRAGRLNLDQFLMSDYRNVGFAYLYARPPVEYYASVPSNLDGLDVTRTWHVDDAHWRAKGFVGRSKTDGIPLDKVYGVALSRESDGLLLRAGWSHSKLAYTAGSLIPLLKGLDLIRALPIPGVSAEAVALRRGLDVAAEPVTYATLGLTYEKAQWQYAAELTRATVRNSTVNAGYVSIGRRIGDVTVFGIVSGVHDGASAVSAPAWGATLTPVIGPAAARQAQVLGQTAAYIASQSARQTTASLGVRWDILPSVALKAQWDHVKIKPNGGFLWSNANNSPGSANIATVLLDFVF